MNKIENNRMIKISSVFCMLWLMILNGYAQNTADSINPQSFNHKLFEKVLLDKINVYRQEQKVTPLIANILVYKVALDHIEFLKTNKELTHYQPKADKRTVEDRLKLILNVKKYQVGENLAQTYVLKPTYNYQLDGSTKLTVAVTYEEAANYMLYAWLQSEFHKKNILNSNFQISGLASYYDPTNGSLTVVHVLAKIG